MYIVNIDFTTGLRHLDVEAEADENKIYKIRVWDDLEAKELPFFSLTKADQELVIEEIWKRVVMEIQADDLEKKRLKEGFHKIWVEATTQGYTDWLNKKEL